MVYAINHEIIVVRIFWQPSQWISLKIAYILAGGSILRKFIKAKILLTEVFEQEPLSIYGTLAVQITKPMDELSVTNFVNARDQAAVCVQ